MPTLSSHFILSGASPACSVWYRPRGLLAEDHSCLTRLVCCKPSGLALDPGLALHVSCGSGPEVGGQPVPSLWIDTWPEAEREPSLESLAPMMETPRLPHSLSWHCMFAKKMERLVRQLLVSLSSALDSAAGRACSIKASSFDD